MSLFSPDEKKPKEGIVLPAETPLIDAVTQIDVLSKKAMTDVGPVIAKTQELDKESFAVQQAAANKIKIITAAEQVRQGESTKKKLGFLGQAQDLADREEDLNQMNPIKRNVFSLFSSYYRNKDLREDKSNLNNQYGVFQQVDAVERGSTATALQNVMTGASNSRELIEMEKNLANGKLKADLQMLELAKGVLGAQLTGMQAETMKVNLESNRRDKVGAGISLDDINKLVAGGKDIELEGAKFGLGDLEALQIRKQTADYEIENLAKSSQVLSNQTFDHLQNRFLSDRNLAELQGLALNDWQVTSSDGTVTQIRSSLGNAAIAGKLAAEQEAAKTVNFITGDTIGRYQRVSESWGVAGDRSLKIFGDNNQIAQKSIGTHAVLSARAKPKNRAEANQQVKAIEAAETNLVTTIDSAVAAKGFSKSKTSEVSAWLNNAPPINSPMATSHVAESTYAGGFSENLDDSTMIPISADGTISMNIGRPITEAQQTAQIEYARLLNKDSLDPIDLDAMTPMQQMIASIQVMKTNKAKIDDPDIQRKVSDIFRRGVLARVVEDIGTFAPKYASATNHPYSQVSMRQHQTWRMHARINAEKAFGQQPTAEQIDLEMFKVMNATDPENRFSPEFQTPSEAYADFISSAEMLDKTKGILRQVAEESPLGRSMAGDWQRGWNTSIEANMGNVRYLEGRAQAELLGDFSQVVRLYGGNELTRTNAIVDSIGNDVKLGISEQELDLFKDAVREAAVMQGGTGIPSQGIPARKVPTKDVILNPNSFDNVDMKRIQRVMMKAWPAESLRLDKIMAGLHLQRRQEEEGRR